MITLRCLFPDGLSRRLYLPLPSLGQVCSMLARLSVGEHGLALSHTPTSAGNQRALFSGSLLDSQRFLGQIHPWREWSYTARNEFGPSGLIPGASSSLNVSEGSVNKLAHWAPRHNYFSITGRKCIWSHKETEIRCFHSLTFFEWLFLVLVPVWQPQVWFVHLHCFMCDVVFKHAVHLHRWHMKLLKCSAQMPQTSALCPFLIHSGQRG